MPIHSFPEMIPHARPNTLGETQKAARPGRPDTGIEGKHESLTILVYFYTTKTVLTKWYYFSAILYL